MNYTQAQIDRANAVSLEDFLRTQGETLNFRGGVKAYQRISNSECHVDDERESDCTR